MLTQGREQKGEKKRGRLVQNRMKLKQSTCKADTCKAAGLLVDLFLCVLSVLFSSCSSASEIIYIFIDMRTTKLIFVGRDTTYRRLIHCIQDPKF